MYVKWIPITEIRPLISYEIFLVCIVLVIFGNIFYHIFLKQISERRHGQLRHRFIVTTSFLALSGLMAGLYWILYWQNYNDPLIQKLNRYLALVTLLVGAIAVVKVAQIYVYLYLFFSNITTGVPRLIGNLFTFIFSLFLFGSIGSAIFGLNIATLATTSAVFSLVLGLALQDTLGNFFSGLALQIDRPFRINDWIEIQDGEQKWVGQVHEVNWRATFLMSFADELMMFPNKTIAQSKIVILTHDLRPVRLNQVFRFTFDTPVQVAKVALLEGVTGFPEIMTSPGVTTLVTETNESFITIKVFYSLKDYGTRFQVGDAIISKVLQSIKKHNLKLAHTTFTVNQLHRD